MQLAHPCLNSDKKIIEEEKKTLTCNGGLRGDVPVDDIILKNIYLCVDDFQAASLTLLLIDC